LGGQVTRILVEPVEVPADDAVEQIEDIHRALDKLGLPAPRLQHGDGEATWVLLTDAVQRGLDTRIGLEDTLYEPNGHRTAGNEALVRAARELGAGRILPAERKRADRWMGSPFDSANVAMPSADRSLGRVEAVRLTVLGGCGAWPAAGQACSGYLVEYEGFRLVIDPGYATLPRLLEYTRAEQVDAVLITHRHPDHCADLNPLLRARALQDEPAAALPVYALPGAVEAVLALDGPGMLDSAYILREFEAGARLEVGPVAVQTRSLPHFVPNAGVRLTAGGRVVAYTGDTGPSPDVVALAAGADLFLAEATFVDQVPERSARYLTSALEAGRSASEAAVGQLVLTHLRPGTDPAASADAARRTFDGSIQVARSGLVVDVT
jgi:ribonuclease BN (tRNA processing enzyme)